MITIRRIWTNGKKFVVNEGIYKTITDEIRNQTILHYGSRTGIGTAYYRVQGKYGSYLLRSNTDWVWSLSSEWSEFAEPFRSWGGSGELAAVWSGAEADVARFTGVVASDDCAAGL